MQTATASSPANFCVAGIPLRIWSDDERFIDEFRLLFGGDDGSGVDPVRDPLDVHLNALAGTFRVDDDLADPASFLAGFTSATIPIARHASSTDARPVLAIRDEHLFSFDGPVMTFPPADRWRRILAHVTFLRLLRLRPDAIFLHAASVAIDGRGTLLIGPKGSGKTTLSAALAARGHAFLGDETAMCIAASGTLVPLRRPLSLKRGPAAAAVERAIGSRWSSADEDGILHIDINEIAAAPAQPAPLRAIIFLRGFAPAPSITRIHEPGREEAALLQPIGGSLSSGNAAQRVFAMFRLLNQSPVFHLHPGSPDGTACLVEEVVRTL